jgi:uroporphyrinogen-III synthase
VTADRVLLTAATPAMQALGARLRQRGLDVLEVPAVNVAPPEDPGPLAKAVASLATYDWLAFTSANAVRAVAGQLTALGSALPGGLRVAALGPSTARAFEETFPGRGVDVQPAAAHHAEALADALVQAGDLGGRRVLLPLSDRARDTLARRLREAGALPETVIAYRTVVGVSEAVAVAPTSDLAVFASPSAVEGFLAMAGDAAAGMAAAVIGPTTAVAAREAGLEVVAVANPSTVEGLEDTILRHLGRRPVSQG